MRFLLFIFCTSIVLISCSDNEDIPTLEVGQDFTNSNVRIVSLDTFAIELSTYKFDSIVTSSTNRILIGQYKDEIFDTTRAESYVELTPINYSISNEAELDSIALILNYDGYFYSDTLKVSSINVHLLSDEVRPEDDVFYNTSTVSHEEDFIATRRFSPEPASEDSIHITIPNFVGQTVFEKIQSGEINDNNELRNEFKGLALLPGKMDDSSIIGFTIDNTETYLRVFTLYQENLKITSKHLIWLSILNNHFLLTLTTFKVKPKTLPSKISQIKKSIYHHKTQKQTIGVISRQELV
ncbi:DUF4270 family protein [Aquimarina mytili]|uniref:DUF4270 family protein n=1 Tax=Aquimarina mytili TaxID=874423 RepID=A0A936ZYI0_9FLAO|nr:DUF4270 family protein [Aquimarina mytili]MBL0684225.1 DUF4270 family protein [Aquimarina mytili]